MEISIPNAEFNFSDVIIRKANQQLLNLYSVTSIAMAANRMKPHLDWAFDLVEEEVNKLNNINHKIIYIVEVIKHLNLVEKEAETPPQGLINLGLHPIGKGINDDGDFINLLTEIKFSFYNFLSKVGYDLDLNSFTKEEVINLNSKIDSILEALERLKAGQEVIFDHIDEVISDYSSLKSDYVLGKKRWYQRYYGIAVSYAGEKGADVVFNAVKPFLKAFLNLDPNIVHKLYS